MPEIWFLHVSEEVVMQDTISFLPADVGTMLPTGVGSMLPAGVGTMLPADENMLTQ